MELYILIKLFAVHSSKERTNININHLGLSLAYEALALTSVAPTSSLCAASQLQLSETPSLSLS